MGDSEGYFGRAPDYFGGDYWGGVYFGDGVARLGRFEEVLAAMKKVKVSESPWHAGIWIRGMWEQSKMREIIRSLEA